MSEKKYTNKLINETSPYLLQHAHNPVEWYPWGEEAFEKAKQENKPVFLSIGYSACHWCHVMEHESFEDEATAKLMNELYINIKVDREERPDVDTIYMNVVQMLTGHGGWPMSVFLTPDKKPFFGGTYYPNVRKYGMPSFKDILQSVHKYYTEKKAEMNENIASIMNNLHIINDYFKDEADQISPVVISKSIELIENYYDSFNGGFGDKPKFPNTFNLDLLLRQYLHTGKKDYLEMAKFTMKKMAEGGIYDQLGGGFFRYSVDEYWLIPHFEKMLYDNSLLIKMLLEVYQLTGEEFYKNKARESLEYVNREMTHPEGGFYSTQDADSEGEEGKFYVWKYDEVTALLGEKEGEIFNCYFGVSKHGNFEHGKSNLHVHSTFAEVSSQFKVSEVELQDIIENGRKKLFAERSKRLYPGKDTKILTSWNGLMISAFAKGYALFQEQKYLETAEKTVNFIYTKLMKDGLLLRTYKDGQAKYNAYLEDYAFFINALIDLQQVTLDSRFLQKASELTDTMVNQFWDEKNGGFFYTGKNHEQLIVRTKEIMDHSIPSGNSVALMCLLRLSRLTENKEWHSKTEEGLKLFSSVIEKHPAGVTSLVCTLDAFLKPPLDIVLTGKSLEEVKPFLLKANTHYNPDVLVYFVDNHETMALYKDKVPVADRPTAYVCRNFTCLKPVNSPEEMELGFLEKE